MNEYLARLVVDLRDKAILAAADVKHGKHTDDVGVRKRGANIHDMSPCCPARDAEPGAKSGFRVWMLFPEPLQGLARNHVHGTMFAWRERPVNRRGAIRRAY